MLIWEMEQEKDTPTFVLGQKLQYRLQQGLPIQLQPEEVSSSFILKIPIPPCRDFANNMYTSCLGMMLRLL